MHPPGGRPGPRATQEPHSKGSTASAQQYSIARGRAVRRPRSKSQRLQRARRTRRAWLCGVEVRADTGAAARTGERLLEAVQPVGCETGGVVRFKCGPVDMPWRLPCRVLPDARHRVAHK
ncbi:hypothetical protein GCM10017562_75230 [Streptomyces roseofulvus]